MGRPAAKKGDEVVGLDNHIVLPPAPAPPVVVPLPFRGAITGGLSADVMIMGEPAAVAGCTAENSPEHQVPGAQFQKPPSNTATVQRGSATVMINGKPAVRAGDLALTCNDPVDLATGQVVVAGGTVTIG